MTVDRHWSMWCVASVNDFMKTSIAAIDPNLKIMFEGQYRKSPETLSKIYSEWVELRVDGPEWTYGQDGVTGKFEVNFGVMVLKSDNNFYRCREIMGICESLFDDPINVYKFGRTTDSENDSSLFDCLRRTKFRGTDKEVLAAYFGELDPKVPIEQATVEGHYILRR